MNTQRKLAEMIDLQDLNVGKKRSDEVWIAIVIGTAIVACAFGWIVGVISAATPLGE
jgi:hypothetical protein